MDLTRREFGFVLGSALPSARLMAAGKPNSNFGGVQIGTITYSFRELSDGAEDVLKYCVDCGISGIELMSNVAEKFAGAPLPPGRGGPGGPAGPPPRGAQMEARPGAPGMGGQRGPGGGRQPLTPEQEAARRKQAEELKNWRLSAPMSQYRVFRKMYEDAGVKIYAFKLPPTLEMSDAEYEYIWNVGEALGANHLTMELPTDDKLLQRVADYATRRKLVMAFHTHGQGGASGFDRVLNVSKYTALNFDVGHFYGVNGQSPVPLMERYHSRIASLHLKDRKGPGSPDPSGREGGPNMPWGQGETPLKEILQVMKKNKYRFPASIEYEYQTPERSNVLTEMKKCVQYCKAALA
jgi:sugar phosphate isomerase/epimerase